MSRPTWTSLLVLIALVAAGLSCQQTSTPGIPLGLPDPRTLPAGVLVDRVPPEADLVFLARRHVLGCPECQDARGAAHERFILQAECNKLVYSAQPQVYWMDVDPAGWHLDHGRRWQPSGADHAGRREPGRPAQPRPVPGGIGL